MRPPFIVVIAAILAIVILAVTFRERVLFAFAPDGINLLKNGSFEDGEPAGTNDEPIDTLTHTCKRLCDGSTTIDGWVASGNGPSINPPHCSNGKVGDALCWVIKSPPDQIHAQDRERFVDLTGFNSRPPSAYGRVSQAVSTDIGKTYEVSFFIGSSINFSTDGLGVRVEIPGVEIPNNGFFDAPRPQAQTNWSPEKSTALPFHGGQRDHDSELHGRLRRPERLHRA
jgi:hypothetical protein